MGDNVAPNLFCGAIVALPVLIILLVWMFFRSAVRSGVKQGSPPPVAPVIQPPVAASLTETRVREIVRDEIRRLRAARGSSGPSSGSPR